MTIDHYTDADGAGAVVTARGPVALSELTNDELAELRERHRPESEDDPRPTA